MNTRVVTLDRAKPKGGGKKTGAGHETPRPGAAWRQAKRLFRYDIPVAREIVKVIRRERIELVHNNDNPRGDRPSMLAARIARVPLVSHVRYTPLYFPAVDRRITKWVHRFLPMSEAIREHLTTNLGPFETPIEVVYDPFHFSVHDRVLIESPVDRTEFGFGPDDYVLANVGRIMPWKGQDVFLRALRKTIDVCPNVKAVIVGAATEKTASIEFWNELQTLTKELGLEDVVQFAGFRKDVPSIMAEADLVVHTATMPEPFGKVLVEAMASRCPVVATGAGGPLEIVEHGETGLLVPASDPVALAQALVTMASDPSRSKAMGHRARMLAEERYGVTVFTQTMTRVFQDALSGGAPS